MLKALDGPSVPVGVLCLQVGAPELPTDVQQLPADSLGSIEHGSTGPARIRLKVSHGLPWAQEVPGSNPGIPTTTDDISSHTNPSPAIHTHHMIPLTIKYSAILAALYLCMFQSPAQVAFVSDRGDEMDIYVFDTDTGAVRRVTTPGEVEYGLVRSRDGQYLSFVNYKPGDQAVWRIKPDGTGKRPFIVSPGRDEIAAFGPRAVKLPGEK